MSSATRIEIIRKDDEIILTENIKSGTPLKKVSTVMINNKPVIIYKHKDELDKLFVSSRGAKIITKSFLDREPRRIIK